MMFFANRVVTGTYPKRFSHPNSKFPRRDQLSMPKKARKPLRVLFVGQSEEEAQALQEELRHNNYDLIFEQLRTQERLAAALGSQSWDIVLAEDAVPGFSALAALEFLQEAKLDLPIILISKDSRGDTALTAVRAGFHDCLTAQERKRLLPAVERELRAAAIRREQKQSQQRYEALVNSIDGIVWEADAKTLQFTFISKQAERLLGYAFEDWFVQTGFWKDHVHPEDYERASALYLKASQERETQDFEYRMQAADGRWVWLRDMVSVSLDKDKEGPAKLQGVMLDITRRKEAEEALHQSEQQFRQSQKMEAIGRMAGGIAHDFNNLLTAITGYSELLLNGPTLDNRVRGNLEEIRKAAGRAAGLTHQLLAFSRRQGA